MSNAKRILRRTLPCAAWLLIGGCTVGPDFTRPAAPDVDRYDHTRVTLPGAGEGQPSQTLAAGSPPAAQWWHAFGSVPLNDTVELALQGSPTLQAANATLAAANESLSAARGVLFPQVDLGASASRGGVAGTGGLIRNLYDVGATLGYSVDLFGGTRRRIEQQAALVDFQRGQLGAAYLALTGNVVTAAINAAGAAEQLAAAQDIIGVDEHNLQLVQISESAGKSTGTDVLAAEGQLANDRTLLPPLRQALAVAQHSLAILTGRTPAQWSPPVFTFAAMTLPSDLPLTLPAELVHARPDIVAAEAQLHAASAAIGVATAQLYPSLTLTGSWRTTAGTRSDLFSANSDVWSIAAGLTAPLFHGGTLRAEQRAAVNTFAAQLAQYRQTVLVAFGQVADALNALEHDSESIAAQHAALEASRASLELTQQSYQAGQTSFLQVLVTQRLFLQSRLGFARAQSQRYLDTALFYLVLGGDVVSAPEAR